MTAIPRTTLADLIDRYAVLLLDAYGVLVTHDGALPGATTLITRLNELGKPYFILTNPDLIYPAAEGRYGFTAGSLALLLEEALRWRYRELEGLRFTPLGKPHSPMFEEAEHRSGTRDMVMIGDQVATDIRGAARFGIDSALVTTGLTRCTPELPPGDRPDFLLESLEL
ncbi:MAG: HAD hydrolase-like protein [Planctomycetota bacterium]